MSDDLHAPDAAALPALEEFVEPAPPRRIGRPWLAWAVILALTALITVSFRQGCVSPFDGLAIVAVFLGVENGHGGKAA